jgi:adenylate cyclase class 2
MMKAANTPGAALHHNLELKAAYADFAAAREVVRRLGAGEAGVEHQTDTYFQVAHGRLKLREISGQPALLIWYDRPDANCVRSSAYHLAPVADATALKAALSAALEVRGWVHKRREIYLWHNVRIHLDDVRGLGPFLEFEAVLSGADDENISRSRLEELCRALAISPAQTQAPSYVDLLGL